MWQGRCSAAAPGLILWAPASAPQQERARGSTPEANRHSSGGGTLQGGPQQARPQPGPRTCTFRNLAWARASPPPRTSGCSVFTSWRCAFFTSFSLADRLTPRVDQGSCSAARGACGAARREQRVALSARARASGSRPALARRAAAARGGCRGGFRRWRPALATVLGSRGRATALHRAARAPARDPRLPGVGGNAVALLATFRRRHELCSAGAGSPPSGSPAAYRRLCSFGGRLTGTCRTAQVLPMVGQEAGWSS